MLPDTVHSAIADISGDGRGDMCVAIGRRVECAIGQGHGFGPRHLALVMPTGNPIIGLWLGDLDGDGKADPCADDGTVDRVLAQPLTAGRTRRASPSAR